MRILREEFQCFKIGNLLIEKQRVKLLEELDCSRCYRHSRLHMTMVSVSGKNMTISSMNGGAERIPYPRALPCRPRKRNAGLGMGGYGSKDRAPPATPSTPHWRCPAYKIEHHSSGTSTARLGSKMWRKTIVADAAFTRDERVSVSITDNRTTTSVGASCMCEDRWLSQYGQRSSVEKSRRKRAAWELPGALRR